MGRSPYCLKGELNRGAWTVTEDKILTDYIKVHGEGKWRNLSKRSGLKRSGKSCRLRWLNYLKPDIKRGNISDDEQDLIIRLHNLLGNRWSLIAGRLPGRTDNEIKNYWNTTLGKKIQAQPSKQRPISKSMHKKPATGPLIAEPPVPPLTVQPQVNQTQALNCTKILVPSHHQNSSETKNSEEIQAHQNHFSTPRGLDNMNMDYGIGDFNVPYSLDSNFMNFGRNDCQVCDNVNREDGYNLSTTSKDCLWFGEPMLEDRTGNDFLQPNASFDLGSLFRFLDSDELK